MIVRKRSSWFRMLLVWRGSILKRVLPQLLLTILVATAVTWVSRHDHWQPGLSILPFSLLGVALAIFLGFRNNASYERFWEARKLWGSLLIETRTLARQTLTLTSTSADERRQLVCILIAFAHALRHQLRGTDAGADLRRLIVDPAELKRVLAARYKPAVLLLLFNERLHAARVRGEIEPILAAAFEPGLAALSGVLGGCERIANTPLPFTYSVIIHRVIYLFAFLLPFGLVETVGLWTPVIVGFASYMFFALEALSDEIEEPFGTMPNDLALDAMTHTTEESLRELLGESWIRPTPQPVDHVLT